MGKIEGKYMGIKHEEADARAKEKGRNTDSDSRRCADVGRKSEGNGSQQKRADRTNCQESSIFTTGSTITGGMLRHLNDEYRQQLANKKHERQLIDAEILRIESRIQEFEALESELEKAIENM
jgi:hypothetical protein